VYDFELVAERIAHIAGIDIGYRIGFTRTGSTLIGPAAGQCGLVGGVDGSPRRGGKGDMSTVAAAGHAAVEGQQEEELDAVLAIGGKAVAGCKAVRADRFQNGIIEFATGLDLPIQLKQVLFMFSTASWF
jgi:hypothetical protein